MDTLLGSHQALRHAHPWEIAILNGVPPNRDWTPLRQGICGLGQMASPLQSAWVMGHYTWMLGSVFGWETQITPEQISWKMITSLFVVRNEAVPENMQCQSVHDFANSVYKAFRHSHELRFVPSCMPAGTDSDQLVPDIRESCAWINSVDICLSDSLDIPKGTMQEQNPGEVNPMIALGNAEEAPRDDHEGNPNQGQENSVALTSPPNPPREEVADQVPEVYTTHGGVRAFSTATSPRVRSGKRSMQQDDAEHRLSLQQRRDDEVKSTNLHGMVQVDNLGQSFQDEEGAEEIPLTPMLKECIEAIEKDVDQECSTTVETARDNHIILVYRDDCLTPDFLRVSKDHTVGSITVADDRMGLLCMCTGYG